MTEKIQETKDGQLPDYLEMFSMQDWHEMSS
jgi:hypothetical protein